MMPTAIVSKAKEKDLDIIAVTDHNSAGNVKAVQEAGKKEGLTVIGGIEICSEEEVHLLAYFDKNEDLFNMEEIVQSNLPGVNDPEAFGDQVFLDSNNKILGISEKLLFGATTLSIDRIIELVHHNCGIIIAAHADREIFSIISQLGYIPKGMALDGIELVKPDSGDFFDYPVITCSDAHYIEDIGKRITEFRLKEPYMNELAMALKEEDGRSVIAYS